MESKHRVIEESEMGDVKYQNAVDSKYYPGRSSPNTSRAGSLAVAGQGRPDCNDVTLHERQSGFRVPARRHSQRRDLPAFDAGRDEGEERCAVERLLGRNKVFTVCFAGKTPVGSPDGCMSGSPRV